MLIIGAIRGSALLFGSTPASEKQANDTPSSGSEKRKTLPLVSFVINCLLGIAFEIIICDIHQLFVLFCAQIQLLLISSTIYIS